MKPINIAVIVAVILIGLIYFLKNRDDGTIPVAKSNELDNAISQWKVESPKGNMYIATQKDTAVGLMVESPDQLNAYRESLPHKWQALADDEVIENEDFSVKGSDMKTEYCQWERPDGKVNVICLCYNLLIVYMVVEEPVVEKAN